MKNLIKSLRRIRAIAGKEWIQIRRDLRSMALSLALPIILILLFGYALSMDVKHVNFAILDQDKTPLSRNFLDNFFHSEYFSTYKYLSDSREIDPLIRTGAIVMAIVIPENFEKKYKTGKSPDFQVIIDGSDSTSATVALGYVNTILYNFNNKNKVAEMNGYGLSSLTLPIDIRTRIWYNAELKSQNYIVPGIIVIIMAIISALITSLTISREWERGTMESLITTPLRRHEIFFGKLFPYVFIAFFDLIIAVCIGYFVFQAPIRGSFIELYLVALLFLIGASSMGIFISSATKSQVLSVQMSVILTYLPSFILSGYIFPVKNMPFIVQIITYLIPAKYLIVYMKGIALKGIGYMLMWEQILFLFLFAVVMSFICLRNIVMKLPEG
ncbi:MAG: ABC transporter permease [Brevinematales bacterium]|jgi:ABC-2 type transport system permease protein